MGYWGIFPYKPAVGMFECEKSRCCIYKLLVYKFATGCVAPLIYSKQTVHVTATKCGTSHIV